MKTTEHRIMTEKEYQMFQTFKKEGNRHFELDSGTEVCPWTDEFARTIQLFRILTDNIDFSKPFRIVIDYDPEQPRTILHYCFKESDSQ